MQIQVVPAHRTTCSAWRSWSSRVGYGPRLSAAMGAAVNTWADHAAWDRCSDPAVPCRLGAPFRMAGWLRRAAPSCPRCAAAWTRGLC